MRKLFVLPIVFAAFFAGFDVYGATARGGRSVASSIGATVKSPENQQKQTTSATVSARTANRTAVRGAPTTNKSSSAVSARAATRTSVARGAVQRVNSGVSVKSASATTARAGVKQKAINLGTKVNVATENTTISKECRDAFNGCMDSFCMIDNASGGRCRCDDRVDELDSALDEIMEINTRSDVIKTDGVKRLQMGEDADAVEAWAKDAAAKTLANDKKNRKDFLNTDTDSKKNKLSLDLDSLGLNLFDVDDLFEEIGTDTEWTDFSDKRGADLRNAAMKMCGSKLPAQCKEDLQMLTSVYGVQIQTNCLAYTNNLKQLKMEAEANYKNAMRDLRDAALVAYNEANKYKTAGQCAVAFKQCMVSEDVCGNGFEKCVINPRVAGKSSKITKPIEIKTGKNIAFQISAATYQQLEAEKGKCEPVLKQCVNVSKDVWNTFLTSIAAEITSTELAKEDEGRRNCVPEIVDCIVNSAKAHGLQEGTDGWEYFTMSPDSWRDICNGPLEQCNAYDASGNIDVAITKYIELSLNAIRADNCTEAVKKCITDGCGDNYSECVGYTVSDLKQICPSDYLDLYCSGKDGYSDIYQYVDDVAKGLLLNVHNDLLTKCLAAVNSSLETTLKQEVDFSGVLDTNLSYGVGRCVKPIDTEDKTTPNGDENWRNAFKCAKDESLDARDNVSALSEVDATCPKWEARIIDNGLTLDAIEYTVGKVTYEENNNQNQSASKKYYTAKSVEGIFKPTDTQNTIVSSVVKKMNETYKNLVNSVETNVNVAKCMNGGTIDGFATENNITRTGYGFADADDQNRNKNDTMVFKNLTNDARAKLAEAIYNRFVEQYSERISDLQEEIDTANGQINKLYEESGQVCPTDGGTTAVADTCKMGHCDDCRTAEAKCRCIAVTYFQYGFLKYGGYSRYEMVALDPMIAEYSESDKKCNIRYRRFASCDSCKDHLGENGKYQEDNTRVGDRLDGCKNCYNGDIEDDRNVSFVLDKKTKISISECTLNNDDSKAPYGDVLTIGETQITFAKCTEDRNEPDGWTTLEASYRPDRGDGACGWCSLSKMEDKGNNAYSITKGDKKVGLKQSRYYDEYYIRAQ